MAHQTGIVASSELRDVITTALSGSLRLVQVTIDQSTEKLVSGITKDPAGTWEQDFDQFIQPILDDTRPCYIFYRLDERNAYDNHCWIFLSFTPDDAKVREKMLYAATKATLKKEFSSGLVIDDLAATKKHELSLDGYRSHMETANAPPPLTQQEQELKELNDAMDHADIGTATRQSHLHGVAFPLKPDAIEKLKELKSGQLQYVQLSIDLDNEEVQLSGIKDNLPVDMLAENIPETKARYHLYNFKHTHEGDSQECFVFIYSCPGYKCPIKERMLYSSCKVPLLAVVAQIGIKIAKKMELDSPKEMSEQYLMDEVHPKTQAYRSKFEKPKPPQRRAAKKK